MDKNDILRLFLLTVLSIQLRGLLFYKVKEKPIKSYKLHQIQTVRTYMQMSFLGKNYLYYQTHYVMAELGQRT